MHWHVSCLLLLLPLVVLAVAAADAGRTAAALPRVLTAGHANLTSINKLHRFARRYAPAPLVIAAAAASSCGPAACAPHEREYAVLSRRLRALRIPFLRVDADERQELVAQIGGRGAGIVHGVYWRGKFHRYGAYDVAGLELLALKLRAAAVHGPLLQLNSTRDVAAFARLASPHLLFAGVHLDDDEGTRANGEVSVSDGIDAGTDSLQRSMRAVASATDSMSAVIGFFPRAGGDNAGGSDDDDDDDVVEEYATAAAALAPRPNVFFAVVRDPAVAAAFAGRPGWPAVLPALTVHRHASLPDPSPAASDSGEAGGGGGAGDASAGGHSDDRGGGPDGGVQLGPPSDAVVVAHAPNDGLRQWVAVHTLPLVGELVSAHHFAGYASTGRPTAILFLDLGDPPPGGPRLGSPVRRRKGHEQGTNTALFHATKLLAEMEIVARELRGKANFAFANGNAFDGHMRGMGLVYGSHVLPALAVDTRDGRAVPFSEDGLPFDARGAPLGAGAVRSLVRDVLAGRLPLARYVERDVAGLGLGQQQQQQQQRPADTGTEIRAAAAAAAFEAAGEDMPDADSGHGGSDSRTRPHGAEL